MQLPGSLKMTTLGDLLGSIFRAGASGTLELVETSGRTHRVFVSSGRVTAVEVDRATPSLAEMLRRLDAASEDTLRRSLLRALSARRLHGEVLVTEFQLSPDVIDRALRQQLSVRLHALEQLQDARIHFRAAVRAPRGALLDRPLSSDEFLRGRARARDRGAAPPPPRSSAGRPNGVPDPHRARAFQTLGVSYDADEVAIKAAYRRLVRAYHPDLHPHAKDDERRALAVRFSEVTAAYKQILAA
jgi:DnaJ-domain-containing protein 1